MNPEKLSERLHRAAQLVPDGKVVMDVGSDRGDFAIALERKSIRVYAVEDKKGPYRGLVANLERHASKVVPLLQDGLQSCPADVNVLTLLGMGGRTIRDILSRGEGYLSRMDSILISPQSEFSLPIAFLIERGFANRAGFYVFETRRYPVLLFEPGEDRCSWDELDYGPFPWRCRDKVLGELLKEEDARLRMLPDGARKAQAGKIEVCQRRLARWNSHD